MPDEESLTVAEVGRRLKLHEETVRRWVRQGKLLAIRFGPTRAGLRIRASELARLLADAETTSKPGVA